MPGLWHRVQGLGFWVQGLGFGVQGFGASLRPSLPDPFSSSKVRRA